MKVLLAHNHYHRLSGENIVFNNERLKFHAFCWRHQQVSADALNRAAEFSWDNKAKRLNAIYMQVMEEWANESIARP